MNNKGTTPVGFVLVGFIAIVVALAMYTGGIAPNVGTMTQTVNYINTTNTMPNVTTALALKITNAQAITNVIITNGSGIVVNSGNYTVSDYQLCDGNLCVVINGTTNTGYFVGHPINLTYNAEPLGYVKENGSRSIVLAMVLLIALAIVVAALSPQIKELADKF